LITRNRKQAPGDTKDESEHETDPEGRHRKKCRREDSQREVGNGSAADSCEDAEHSAEDHREKESVGDEIGAGLHARGDESLDRLAEGHGLAEVASDDPREVRPQLREHRLIEAQSLSDRLHILGRHSLTEHDPHRVARHGLENQKHNDHQAEQLGQTEKKPPEEVVQHAYLPLPELVFELHYSENLSQRSRSW